MTLTLSLALQFHLSYWSIEGWPHDGAGAEWGTPTAIGLGLSSLACVLANAAATRAPLHPLLLAAVNLTLTLAPAPNPNPNPNFNPTLPQPQP